VKLRRRWLVGPGGLALAVAVLGLTGPLAPAEPIGPAGYARNREGRAEGRGPARHDRVRLRRALASSPLAIGQLGPGRHRITVE
jgi:hypothetical protein